MTSRTLRLLPSGQDTNTRRYPRSLAEAFPHGPEYGCAIERPAPRKTRLGLLVCVLLVCIITATSAHADLLPDAVEIPVATRHLEHNDRLRNDTPGVVADEKLCKKQPAGLHVTSCAVWLGLRGEW